MKGGSPVVKANTQPTLFDAKGKTKRARVPAWVVKELTELHGWGERAARSLPVRQAFAILYAARRKAAGVAESDRQSEAARVRGILVDLSAERDPNPHELTDAAIEALSLLNAKRLSRVCAGLANLLAEVSTAG